MFERISNFTKKYKIFIIVFLLAIVVHSGLFLINFTNNQYDLIPTIKGDDGYFELSKSLIDGNGFTWSTEAPFQPNPLRTPIYPFFIAGILLLFGSYWAVLIIQLFISGLIPLLGMAIVDKVISSKKISIIVGVLLAIEPYSTLFSSIFYTETLFIFLFLVFLFFFFKYFKDPSYRNIIWSSLFFGLAVLTKPTVQYLPVIIPIFIFWHFRKSISKKTIIQIVVFLSIFILTISSWLYRNYEEFGVVGMSAQPAFNLYTYLVPSVLSIANDTSFSIENKKIMETKDFHWDNITLSNSKYYISESLNILKEHKIALIKLSGTSLLTFFTHDGMLTVFGYAGYRPPTTLSKPALFLLLKSPKEFFIVAKGLIMSPFILVLLVRILWILITTLFIFGVFKMFKDKKANTLIVFALLLIAYFAGTTMINGLGINARFRMPINTFIFMFAIYGYFSLINFIRKKKKLKT